MFPPAALIFWLAVSENLAALTVNATFNSPFPKTLTPSYSFLTNPFAFKASKSTTDPAAKQFKSLTFTTIQSPWK